MAIDYEAVLNGAAAILGGAEPDDVNTTGVHTAGDLVQKRTFSADERKQLASRGFALPDGSFPIVDDESLEDAIQSIGRASDAARAKKHIIKRARALGETDKLPEDWHVGKSATPDERAELTGITVKNTEPQIPDELQAQVDNPEAWADWTNLWGPLDAGHLPETVKSVADLQGYRLDEAQVVLENIVYAQMRLNDELEQKAVDLRTLQSPRAQALEEEERERQEAAGTASETQKLNLTTKDANAALSAEEKLRTKHRQKQHDQVAMFPGVFCSPSNLDPDAAADAAGGNDHDEDDVGAMVGKSLKATLVTELLRGETATTEQLEVIDAIVRKAVAELDVPARTTNDDVTFDDTGTLAAVTEATAETATPTENPAMAAVLDRIAKLESALTTANDEGLQRQQELEEAQEELREYKQALDEQNAVVTKQRKDLEQREQDVELRLQQRLPDPLKYRESVAVQPGERAEVDDRFRAKSAVPQTTRDYLERSAR